MTDAQAKLMKLPPDVIALLDDVNVYAEKGDAEPSNSYALTLVTLSQDLNGTLPDGCGPIDWGNNRPRAQRLWEQHRAAISAAFDVACECPSAGVVEIDDEKPSSIFHIYNIESGATLGFWRADSVVDALDAMARDAGYTSRSQVPNSHENWEEDGLRVAPVLERDLQTYRADAIDRGDADLVSQIDFFLEGES